MLLSQLAFGALLTYTPHGVSKEMRLSKDVMILLKKDGFVEDPPILMSQWLAKAMNTNRSSLPFVSYFQPDTILIPTPKSSLMQPDTLWVPLRIAAALVTMGFGKQVVPCLFRGKPVPKAAYSPAKQRPVAADHYESLGVESLTGLNDIVLVDDVVTRGATLLGAASRLAEVFPESRIRAFAAMRTISDPSQFKRIYDPCIGTITLLPSGGTHREP